MIDIFLLWGAFALAQDGVPQSPVATPNMRRECRVIGETGSRLARRRICATRAEWIEQDRIARQRLNETQTRQVAPTYDDLMRNSPTRPSTSCTRC